jgi:hypothetical protein
MMRSRRPFRPRLFADAFRAKLLKLARDGEAFDEIRAHSHPIWEVKRLLDLCREWEINGAHKLSGDQPIKAPVVGSDRKDLHVPEARLGGVLAKD